MRQEIWRKKKRHIKWRANIFCKKFSLFNLRIFPGITLFWLFWDIFLGFRLLISFTNVLLSMLKKMEIRHLMRKL